MYKRLRRKFMVVSTLVLLLVIGIVNGGIYFVTTGTIMNSTIVLMNLILENGGTLPKSVAFDWNQETFLGLTDEALYEIRFFSATVNETGAELISTNHSRVIQDDDALTLAEQVSQKKGDVGQIKAGERLILNYMRKTNDDGSMLIVFTDSTSRYNLLRTVMIYIIILWATVVILYIIIMGHYSKKLIRPFIENDEKQKRFITNASHELKTPLAVISANTEMTEVMGGKTKWTESTRRQVKKMQSLVEDLVVLTRLDEMKESAGTAVNFSALTRETAEPFVSVIQNDGKTFKEEMEDGLYILGDRRGAQQIVSILMDNAAKYCDAGGCVKLELKSRGKTCSLSVSNTYAEGKDVDFSRFFERFYRQDESHNSGKAGFGIGLSMGKEIVEHMKGQLRVDWKNDIITFTAELPRTAPDSRPSGNAQAGAGKENGAEG